jgi:hypothetical protein
MTCEHHYVYLHGFASSPESTKARYLSACFDRVGIQLQIPDLNQGDFSHLTISRQINQTAAIFPLAPVPITLIGSSLGGLTAAVIARQYTQVQRLILLAPAFDFLTHWLPKIGEKQLQLWEQDRYLPTYHYGEKKLLRLHYDFLTDARRYHRFTSDRVVPTLILHGIHDDVIPIKSSQNFADRHSAVNLVELDSDHQLTNVSDRIWQEISDFCQINNFDHEAHGIN